MAACRVLNLVTRVHRESGALVVNVGAGRVQRFTSPHLSPEDAAREAALAVARRTAPCSWGISALRRTSHGPIATTYSVIVTGD